ncbi:uncharacterized protein PFL1_01736 [Pseudozyma flocculosa PF-1]|uniref:uncharacterized protein n=1 Tax=Pseudozyma flocculosa PF-1 TaxID=1277687 RepID=UPI0004561ABC|nr:uncharacterized protein PFL1_01736 [Pseudozyma flocculosa PF-1]EPQ30838.1 hypothetical protein PFL1_01736 [Pseudozyma flocculosa PF-1]
MASISAPSSSDDVLKQLQRIRANLASADVAAPPQHRSVVAPASPSKHRPSPSIISAEAKRGAKLLQQQRQDALQYATARAQALTAAAAARSSPGDTSAFSNMDHAARGSSSGGPSSYLTIAERTAAAQRRRQEAAAQEERARQMRDAAAARASMRSAGFNESPQPRQGPAAGSSGCDILDAAAQQQQGPQRDERLALVESLEPGPPQLPPRRQEDDYDKLEPYSGTRLSSRRISHDDVTDYLQGRYYIPPSMIYSVARPTYKDVDPTESRRAGYGKDSGRDGDYEIPVDGDWLTIAVIAEKGPLLHTKSMFGSDDEGSDEEGGRGPGANKGGKGPLAFREVARGADGKLRLELDEGDERMTASERAKLRRAMRRNDAEDELERERKRMAGRSRLFNIMQLVDLGTSGQKAASGDRQLKLMSFEADEVDENMRPLNSERADIQRHLDAMRRDKRRFVNGSRGAFELLHKQTPGTLVAILNPRITQPRYKKDKILTLKPRSAEDILIIGQTRDLTTCCTKKRDGSRCGNYVDVRLRRQGTTGKKAAEDMVCDYHLTQSIGGMQRGRMEFANSTNGLGSLPPGARSQRGSSGGGGGGLGDGKAGGWGKRGGGAGGSQPYQTRTFQPRHGNMDEGLSSNAGRTFTVEASQPVAEGKPTDPESWRFDIGDKLGRGRSEKEARLRKQMEKDELERRMRARFGDAVMPNSHPGVAMRKRVIEVDDGDEDGGDDDDDDDDDDEQVLPGSPSQDRSQSQSRRPRKRDGLEAAAAKLIDPQGSAAKLLEEAKRTIEERKRKAEETKAKALEKRRKILGIKSTAAAPADKGRSKSRSALDPLTNGAGRDSRSALLDRIKKPSCLPRPPTGAQLKLKKQHRPRYKTFDEGDGKGHTHGARSGSGGRGEGDSGAPLELLQGIDFDSDGESDALDLDFPTVKRRGSALGSGPSANAGNDQSDDEEDLEIF